MNWLRIQMAVLDAASGVVSFAASWLVQSTLLIAVGLAAACWMRRRGSALQSAIYRTTLAAAIVCPLASWLLAVVGVSGWSLPMPATWTYEDLTAPVVASPEPAGTIAPRETHGLATGDARPSQSGPLYSSPRASHLGPALEPLQPSLAYGGVERPAAEGPRDTAVTQGSLARPADGPASTLLAASAFRVRTFGMAAIGIFLVWLSASSWMLARLLRAWRRLNRLCREAMPAEKAIQEVCRELTALLNTGVPKVLRSPYLSSPCLAGWPRSVVLLPEADTSLPARDVLIHELAHLRRGDTGWNLLGRLAESLFFYQPLVWILTHRLESTAEEVCDDYVVQFGGDRSRYARGLVEIAELSAELSTTAVGVPAVAVVSLRSILAKRVTRIMDSSRSLSTRAGNLLLIVVILGGLAGTMAVGFVGLSSRHSLAEAQPAAEDVTDATDEPSDDLKPNQTPQAKPEEARPPSDEQVAAEEKEYRGKVVGADGQPLAGAEIWLAVSPYDHVANTIQGTLRRVAVSDSRGDFSFRLKPIENAEQFPTEWTQFASIVAKAPGHGCDWLPLVLFEQDPVSSEERNELQQRIDKALGGRFAGRTLKLPREVGPVRGRLVDLEGRPIMGVTVLVESIQSPDMAMLRDGLEQASRNVVDKGLSARWPQGWLGRRNWQALVPPVKTDDKGEFSFSGLGRDQVATVTLSGHRLEAERFFILGTEMETKRVPHISFYPKGAQDSFVGVNFSLAVGPAVPVSGVVTEFKTGKPIAGAMVFVERLFSREGRDTLVQLRLSTSHIRAVTDAQGRYRLDGIPPGQDHVLNVTPPKSEPWLIASQTFSLDPGQPSATVDMQVFRGIWIEGKVTDADTGEPIEGRVDYLALRNNPNIPQKFGLEDGWEMGRFPIAAGGLYRTVGLPGPGLLLVRSSGKTVYPLSVGAEKIEGYEPAGVGYLPTTPVGYPLSNWHLIRFIDPSVDAESYNCDLTLSAGVSLVGRVVGPNDSPVPSIEAMGLVEKEVFFGPLNDEKFTLTDYRPDVPRNLFFRTADQSLVGYLHLEGKPPADLTVRLQTSVTVRGTLIETETGEPAAGYGLYCESSKQGDFRIADTTTDMEGGFELKGLMAGNVYQMDSFNVQRFSNQKNRFTIDLTDAKPGDLVELGDVTGKNAKGILAPADGPDSADDTRKASSDRPADTKTVRGRVTRDARPASGAHVAVIGDRTAVGRGGDLDWGHEVLAEATADENGEYVLRLAGVSQQTHNYPRVIARQDGSAIAWRELNLDAAETQADFELQPEEPLRGKLVDLEGQPAAGVRLSIASVVGRTENEGNRQGVGYRPSDRIPAAWIAPITSDKQGVFVVHGLAANQGVTFEVAGDDRFAQQDIALNTGSPEERGERDRTYRPLIKNAKRGEEVVLVLAPAQVFEGTVRYADSGEPVPHARLTIWASQEELGSMISVAGSADEQGRYHITPRPGIRFGLTAYPPAGAPYLVRTLSQPIHWEGGERIKKVDLTLPRGVLVRGTVVEAGSGAPVTGAALQYYPESSNNSNDSDDIVTRWQSMEVTDNDGRFVMAVLPGPGRLLVNGPQGKYVLQEIGDRELYSGKPGGTRNYVHAVAPLNPKSGQEPVEVRLELQPGATVNGRIVDEAGTAIDEALVISRLNISPYSLSWRGHTTPTLGGQFELAGLAEGIEYPVYFLDPRRRLGATQLIKAGDAERTVVLKPCGKATLRLVDDKGEPAPQYAFIEMVVTPGASRYDPEAFQRGELEADADFISNVDRMNNPLSAEDDENGVIHLPALIPGASYRVLATRRGRIQVVKEFQVKPDETVDLGEITVERD